MRPTLRGARLCSTQDVILICWAVARNVIPLITRRLDNDERKQLRSGDIFVWEERVDPEGLGPGIERWTDGMKWGPSRVKNEFLFYHQKTSERREERRLSVDDHHASSAPNPPEVYGYEADPEHCLVKQSYSVKLKLPETKNEEKKWHITAYFTPATVEFLRPVSTFPEIGNADVPSGWIEAARGHKQLKLEPPSATSSAIPISREPYASSSSSSSLSAPEGSHHSDARLYRPSTVGHHYTDGSHTAATYSPPSRPSHSILLSASPPTSTGIASSSSSSSSSTIAAPTRHPRLPEYVHMQQHNGSGSSSSSSHQHHDDDPMTGSRLQSPPPASRPMHEHRRAHHSSASSSSPYARVRQSPPELSFRRMHLDGADDEVTKTVSHHHHHQKQQQQQSSHHHHHHHQSYQQQQQHKSPSSFHDNLSLPPSSFNVSTSPTSTAAAAMMMIGAAASRKSDRDLVPLSKLRGNQVPPRDPADQLQLRMLPLSRILG